MHAHWAMWPALVCFVLAVRAEDDLDMIFERLHGALLAPLGVSLERAKLVAAKHQQSEDGRAARDAEALGEIDFNCGTEFSKCVGMMRTSTFGNDLVRDLLKCEDEACGCVMKCNETCATATDTESCRADDCFLATRIPGAELSEVLFFAKGSTDNLFTTVGATATAKTSGSPTSFGPENLIDGSISTRWLDFAGGVEVLFEFDEPVDVDAYQFVTGNSRDGDPVEWKLYASDDQQEWALLSHVVDRNDTHPVIPRSTGTNTELLATDYCVNTKEVDDGFNPETCSGLIASQSYTCQDDYCKSCSEAHKCDLTCNPEWCPSFYTRPVKYYKLTILSLRGIGTCNPYLINPFDWSSEAAAENKACGLPWMSTDKCNNNRANTATCDGATGCQWNAVKTTRDPTTGVATDTFLSATCPHLEMCDHANMCALKAYVGFLEKHDVAAQECASMWSCVHRETAELLQDCDDKHSFVDGHGRHCNATLMCDQLEASHQMMPNGMVVCEKSIEQITKVSSSYYHNLTETCAVQLCELLGRGSVQNCDKDRPGLATCCVKVEGSSGSFEPITAYVVSGHGLIHTHLTCNEIETALPFMDACIRVFAAKQFLEPQCLGNWPTEYYWSKRDSIFEACTSGVKWLDRSSVQCSSRRVCDAVPSVFLAKCDNAPVGLQACEDEHVHEYDDLDNLYADGQGVCRCPPDGFACDHTNGNCYKATAAPETPRPISKAPPTGSPSVAPPTIAPTDAPETVVPTLAPTLSTSSPGTHSPNLAADCSDCELFFPDGSVVHESTVRERESLTVVIGIRGSTWQDSVTSSDFELRSDADPVLALNSVSRLIQLGTWKNATEMAVGALKDTLTFRLLFADRSFALTRDEVVEFVASPSAVNGGNKSLSIKLTIAAEAPSVRAAADGFVATSMVLSLLTVVGGGSLSSVLAAARLVLVSQAQCGEVDHNFEGDVFGIARNKFDRTQYTAGLLSGFVVLLIVLSIHAAVVAIMHRRLTKRKARENRRAKRESRRLQTPELVLPAPMSHASSARETARFPHFSLPFILFFSVTIVFSACRLLFSAETAWDGILGVAVILVCCGYLLVFLWYKLGSLAAWCQRVKDPARGRWLRYALGDSEWTSASNANLIYCWGFVFTQQKRGAERSTPMLVAALLVTAALSAIEPTTYASCVGSTVVLGLFLVFTGGYFMWRAPWAAPLDNHFQFVTNLLLGLAMFCLASAYGAEDLNDSGFAARHAFILLCGIIVVLKAVLDTFLAYRRYNLANCCVAMVENDEAVPLEEISNEEEGEEGNADTNRGEEVELVEVEVDSVSVANPDPDPLHTILPRKRARRTARLGLTSSRVSSFDPDRYGRMDSNHSRVSQGTPRASGSDDQTDFLDLSRTYSSQPSKSPRQTQFGRRSPVSPAVQNKYSGSLRRSPANVPLVDPEVDDDVI
ncbi:hypothetical protein DIPPA_30823 [Diplonema papillatum]|nr:hypothetical protein DIPPA_30823 [Diplonema papillatum]